MHYHALFRFQAAIGWQSPFASCYHGSLLECLVENDGSALWVWSLIMNKSVLARLYLVGSLSLLAVVAGCGVLPDKGLSCPASETVVKGFNRAPRVRFGCYPSANLGTYFKGPDLGVHGYYSRLTEQDGIAYTCRGGDIDVIHLRIAADWTAYLSARTYDCLMKHKSGFSYKLAADRSKQFVTFTYPENWDKLSRDEQATIARDVAVATGPYLTYQMVTWHEILTWFGFKCLGLGTEFPSAFSWEDGYSNLLGTIIGTRALQDSQHPFNEAVKIALDEEMQKLGIQSGSVAKKASQSVEGQWYTGSVLFFVDIKKRNFDTGDDDGFITPTLLPGVSECPDAEPVPYPVPTLEALARHGFSARVEIEPHEWESGKIRRIISEDKPPKRIIPEEHFAPIMAEVRRQGVAKYGSELITN